MGLFRRFLNPSLYSEYVCDISTYKVIKPLIEPIVQFSFQFRLVQKVWKFGKKQRSHSPSNVARFCGHDYLDELFTGLRNDFKTRRWSSTPQGPTVTLTCDLRNLNRSSVGANKYSLSVLSKLFKAFNRYHGKNGTTGELDTVGWQSIKN